MNELQKPDLKVVALAGGVGGAKLADGLAQALQPENLTVIVNVGDDFDLFGLKISPDLDTVCYTLAGLSNFETGWGRADETWQAISAVKVLGGPTWFGLGDRDLGTHLERTRRLQAGDRLSVITRDFCLAWGIAHSVLPATDEPTPTLVKTDSGWLPFQEYFVQLRCEPVVRAFEFSGAEKANPAPGVLEALQDAELVVFCPSNPWVSLAPILAIEAIRRAVAQLPVVAISPIIGGKAVKGPAAKMYAEMGVEPSAVNVARHYGPLLSGFVMDQVDANQVEAVAAMDIKTLVTNTLMQSLHDRLLLARQVLDFGQKIAKGNE